MLQPLVHFVEHLLLEHLFFLQCLLLAAIILQGYSHLLEQLLLSESIQFATHTLFPLKFFCLLRLTFHPPNPNHFPDPPSLKHLHLLILPLHPDCPMILKDSVQKSEQLLTFDLPNFDNKLIFILLSNLLTNPDFSPKHVEHDL